MYVYKYICHIYIYIPGRILHLIFSKVFFIINFDNECSYNISILRSFYLKLNFYFCNYFMPHKFLNYLYMRGNRIHIFLIHVFYFDSYKFVNVTFNL